MQRNLQRALIVFLLLCINIITGCAPVIIGGGAAVVGGAVAEERGMGGALTDTEIRTRINLTWYQHNREMHGKLGLTVHEGRVLIAGTVATEQMHLDAVRLAWQAKGVKEVIDQITVMGRGETLGDVTRDSWITTKLKSNLLFDGQVASRNYTLVTVSSIVYIMGVAQSQAELLRITDHARRIKGVRKVISYARVKGDPAL